MKFVKVFIVPLILILVCVWLLRSAYVEVRNRAVDQLNEQQLVMAETAARGIESVFEHYGELLNQISRMKEIVSFDEQGRQLMQALFRTHEEDIRGVTRVDASGRIIYTYPEINGAVGTDVSSQEHIREIMETHQPVVSDVFDSVQGFPTVAFHVPVFEGETYRGSLCVLVPFDRLSRKYLEPIRSGKDGYAWIISRNGIELYCPVPGHVGKSVFENCKDFPTILSMAGEMLRGKRGATTYLYDQMRGETFETVKKQAVYAPIRLANTFWSIVVATPESEVLAGIHGFRDKLLLIIGFLMVISVVWTSYVLRAFKILKEEEKRRQAEKALKESEEKYRELVENSNSIILGMDTSGNVTFFNEFASRFFGYSEEEIIGNHLVGTIVPEVESTGRDLRAMIEDVVVNPDRHTKNINENMRRDGERVWVAWANKPIRDDNGRVVEVMCIGNDITGLRRTEEKLRESEAGLRSVLEASPAGVALLVDRVFSKVSAAHCRITGYSEHETEGRTSRFLHLDDEEYDRIDRVVHQQMDATGVGMTESRIRRKDGKIIDVLLCLSPFDPKDRAAGVTTTVLDITERKRTEDALRDTERKLRSLVDNIPDGIARFDSEYRHLLVNPAITKAFGKSPEQFIGKTIRECGSPENDAQHEVLETMIKRVFEEGVANSVELQSVTRAGLRFLHFLHIPERDESGKVVSVLGISQDITERKRAEEQLRASESKLRSVFRAAPVGITFSLDRVLMSVNDLGCELTGYSEEEQVGKSVRQLYVNDEEYENTGREMFSQLREKGRASLETRFRRKDGTIIYTNLTAAMLRPEDPSAGCVVTIQDITERKRAEEERAKLEERLQRAEKMEALGTLAGGVAHDLNNVLGIVVGFSELLLDGLDRSSPARSKAAAILEGGQRAAAIVQDLLTLARRGVPSRRVLNLNNIVLECQNSHQFAKVLSYHPKVVIKTYIETDLLNIVGSSVHLEKSFLNLVANAAEAMPDGGVLSVKTANCYLDEHISGYDEVREGDYVVLSVSDTGEGIPVGDLKRIFEPFYTKKIMGRSGTGLGLAVVWGTVRDHNGYINVQSEESRGTTFTLYFPVTREELTPDEISLSFFEYMGKGQSILVVDDVKEQRDLAATMLTKLNYRVVSLAGGEEAVEYLKNNSVDLVLLDMIMDPGMDGLDTYTKILEIHPHQKAIIVSGFSETERVSKAQALGVGSYVRKPYLMEKLGVAVKKELDRYPP